jgi:hypothetical protein
MAVIRVELAREFRGEDVVLLAMDADGVDSFLTAITRAEQHGAWRLDHGGMIHEFLIEAGAADIDLQDDRVVWRLGRAKAVEMIEKLTALTAPGPGHHYVDISKPTCTLVLSCDEYV